MNLSDLLIGSGCKRSESEQHRERDDLEWCHLRREGLPLANEVMS
jgi:hypothetical protein